MSKANPRKAVAALLPLPLDCGEGVSVRPMTLGMWAALERIGSPLVTGREPSDTLELLPSLYLLTHDPREVLRGDLLASAIAWADTVTTGAMGRIRSACARQMNAFFDVLPEVEKKKDQSGTTDGSPCSSTGRRPSTDGASPRSCGTCRSPRSRCSAGSGSSRKARSSRFLK